MWRRPVTFGGGIGMTKGFLLVRVEVVGLASGEKQPEDSHLEERDERGDGVVRRGGEGGVSDKLARDVLECVHALDATT
jgi:hypothetical protein